MKYPEVPKNTYMFPLITCWDRLKKQQPECSPLCLWRAAGPLHLFSLKPIAIVTLEQAEVLENWTHLLHHGDRAVN